MNNTLTASYIPLGRLSPWKEIHCFLPWQLVSPLACRSSFNKRFKSSAWLILLAGLVICLLLASGCATVSGGTDPGDPLEPGNRKVYNFNDALDRHVFKPVADTYVTITPQPVRTAVSHFFDNVGYVNVIVNDFLQGKFKQGASDTGRFVVNSTVGILGFFDVATPAGLKEHDEDFGQTLGVWGSGPGGYLVLPAFGPNTVRDAPGLAVSTVTNALFYLNSVVTIPLAVLGAIDARARASSAIKFRNEAALDPYIFTREAWLQRRNFLVYDGNPPVQEIDEEFDEDIPPDEGAVPDEGVAPDEGATPNEDIAPAEETMPNEGTTTDQDTPPPENDGARLRILP